MKQGINKALALFLAVVLAFSPIAAAFGDSMTVYATEVTTESETGRSRSAADLHEALETRAETETKVVQNDNKISDDTGKDDGDTTGSGNSSSNGNSNNAGNSDNGGSKRETPAQPTTQEYTIELSAPTVAGVTFENTITLTVTGTNHEVKKVSGAYKVELPIALNANDIQAEDANYKFDGININGKIIEITKAIPKASVTEVTGEESIEVGNTKKYEAVLSDNKWANAVTWEISPSGAVDWNQATKGREVNITAKGFDGDTPKEVTLTAKVENGATYTKTVSLKKKTPETSLSLEVTANDVQGKEGWEKSVSVKIKADSKLNGKSVEIVRKNEKYGFSTQTVTIDNGQAEIKEWKFDHAGTYSFTAKFGGDKEYVSQTSDEVTYDTQKAKQDLFEVTGDNLKEEKDKNEDTVYTYTQELTYGDQEVVLGEVTGGTTPGSWDIKDYTFETAGNNVVTIDENNKIHFTPKQAGTYDIKVGRQNDDYNIVRRTIKVVVKQKEIAITNVRAPERDYNGSDIIERITTKIAADDLVSYDKKEYANLELQFKGTADNANAGENKTVSNIKLAGDLPENIAKNYKLTGLDTITTTVTIKKKKLTMKVVKDKSVESTEDGFIIRAFDAENKTEGLYVQVEGFVNGESPESLGDYNAPEVQEASNVDDEAPGTTIANYFTVNTLNANPTENYEFDRETATGLGWYITASRENISNNAVSVDNSESKYAYQENAGAKIYYNPDKEPTIRWKIADQYGNKYSQISITEGNNTWTGNSHTDYTPQTEGKIKVKLLTDKGGSSEEFELELVEDTVVPTVAVNINPTNTMYEFGKKITFGHFAKKTYEAMMEVQDSNGSGIKRWSYKKEKVSQDRDSYTEEDFTDYNGFKEVKGSNNEKILLGSDGKNDGESGSFIVFVLVEDNVGNSKLYGSNGLIIDNPDQDKLELECAGEYTKRDNDETYYYGNGKEAKFKIDAEDVDSAVKTVEATIVNEDLPKSDKGKNDQIEVFKIAPLNEGEKGYTLATLEANRTIAKEISKSLDAGSECAKYSITVEAQDLAGSSIGEQQSAVFVLDALAPVVQNEIAYSDDGSTIAEEHQKNNIYYSNKGVKITTTVTERFTDESLINLNLTKDDKPYGPKTLQEWEDYAVKNKNEFEIKVNKNGLTEKNEATTTISFTVYPTDGEEHQYSYSVSAKDYSGNESDNSNEIKFCLDKEEPKVEISYRAKKDKNTELSEFSPQDGIYYLGENYEYFVVGIKVSESYIKSCNYGVEAKDFAGNNVTASAQISSKNEETPVTNINGDIWGTTEGEYNFTYSADANYTFSEFTVTDLAGNKKSVNAARVTLDTEKPKATITVDNLVSGGDKNKQYSWIDNVIKTITFGFFGRDEVKVTLKNSDVTSGIDESATKYLLTPDDMTLDDLKKTEDGWKDYEPDFSLEANSDSIVYEKVVDKAGNTEYYCSDHVIVDNQNPGPEITITSKTPKEGNAVYSADDQPGFKVEVTDSNDEKGAYAGLKEVSYSIRIGEKSEPIEKGVLASYTADKHVRTYEDGHVDIDPKKFYSNDVWIKVTASDYSGNESATEQKIAVDNQAPVVSFDFGASDEANEGLKHDKDDKKKYYNHEKTLTITVNERNFDDSSKPKVTSSTNKGWSFSGWTISEDDPEKHVGIIKFTGDGDYTVSYWCKDKAGNVSVTKEITENGEEKTRVVDEKNPLTLPEFTIDKTAPTIKVEYMCGDGKTSHSDADALGKEESRLYYPAVCTATITVTEHNFAKENVTIKTEGSLDGGPSSIQPSKGEWKDLGGDKYEITYTYSADADYTLKVSAVDKAGNSSEPKNKNTEYTIDDQFTVDQKDPEVFDSKIAYVGSDGAVNDIYYSNTDVTLTTTIKERHTDDEHINLTLTRDDEEKTLSLAEWNNPKIKKGNFSNVRILRGPANADHESSITVVIPAVDNKEIHYKYSVTVKDYAANTATGGNLNFWLDQKKPEINSEIAYVGSTKAVNEDEGVYYSNKDVELTTTIREQLIDDEKIDLSLIVDGKETKATLKDWKNTEGVTLDKSAPIKDDNTTNATRTIKLRIAAKDNEEHHYIWSVSATDYAGNNDFPSTKTEFWLDKKAPDADITYTLTEKKNNNPGTTFSNPKQRVYVGEDYSNFVVNINVDEAHFVKHTENGKKVVACTYDAIETTNVKDPISVQVITPNSKNKGTDIKEIKDVLKKASSWAGPLSQHSYTFTCTADANYTFPEFTVTDLAGNTTTVSGAKITLDKVRPTGTLKVTNLISGGTKGEISWNKLVSKLSFGLFGKNSVKVSMSSEDATAGLKSTQYIVTDTLKKRSELEAETKWKDYKKGSELKFNKNRDYIVYEKVVDKAGNTEYFGTDRVVVDGNSPKPEVTITPSAPRWGKGVYSASDNPGFDIQVIDPIENDSYAGLKSVTYTISGGANGYKESNTVTFTAKDHRQSYTGHVNIDPSRFYSNNVQVTVEAVDYSTNGASKQTEEIKIDNQAPKVSFSFDKSDAVGGKYYNKDKTLTITVDERNFDDSYKPEVTSSTNQGWSFSGWSSSGEKHTGTITFTGDADYTVSYFCYDKAGNKSNTEKLDEITIDKTKPTVAVSYDNNNAKNGNYYQEGRTATITITEHNFNASGVTVTTTANLDGGSVATPQASGWSSSGDTHTATISYPTDGDYTFTISITDMASNVSDPYATDSFTVDLTKPTIEISNIEDHSANKGTVAPVVTLNDTNFDRSNVNIQLTGVHKGVVNTANMYTTADTGKGQVITFANFGKNMDDIYTLKAETTDKAGNAYSTEIVFSVNRDGSTYQYNDYTEELLKKGYTNNPKDIVVSEINVDSLTLSELTLSKNGTVLTLKEGQDYDVQKSGGDVSWKEYVYTIHAANFEDEGDYTISIYSEDKAKNKTTNTSKAKQVEFIVDKTSPVISVANLQDGGHYKTDEQEFTANVDDNMALDKVEYYVDGELKESFDEKAVIEQNGALKLKVGSAAKFQEVSVKAYDKADNEPTIVTMNVLVSASGWVQFYNNKPLFFGTIILILLIVVGGVIIVMRVNRNGSLKMTTNRKEQRK